MRIRIGVAPIIAALAWTSPGGADVLKTRDGRSLEGIFRGATEQEIRFEVGGSVRSFPVKEVAAVGFSAVAAAPEPGRSSAAENPAAAPTAAAKPSAAPAEAVSPPAAKPAPAAAATASPPTTPATATSLSLPAGTRLRARLADALDPRRSAVGDRFAALLEAPIDVEGVRVAPQHTQVYGRVAEVQSGGPSGPSLALELTELLIQGQPLAILTGSEQIAAGASPPAAAAPATAEAGAGGRIPGGTLLEFRLLQPVELQLR